MLASILLLATSRLLAVTPVPYTEGVSFSFRISGVGNGLMTVYDEAGTPSLGQSTSNTTTESAVSTAWLRPGKQYTVNFQASGPWEYWLSYIAPAGYVLLVNDQPTTITYNNPGGGWYSHNYLVELRPVANYQAALIGAFSGIEAGKSVTWEVGTGLLRNGRSAGRLIFKEKDLSSGFATRSRLYYSVAGNYGEIEVIRDGASNQTLRQVRTPQGLLDLVDDAGGGYWIKCYTPAQLEGSPGNPYIIYGSPWKTIRVQSPAAGQLTITDTEGGVAHVSTLTQTMTPTTLATGGTVTTSGNYTIHTFTAGGTFTVNSAITGLDAILVAGGGGGGHQHAGGGGAGGLLPLTSLSVGAGSYSIAVGGGGAGCTWYPYTGNNGGNSSALGYTAIGGGAGTGMPQYGNTGGSGGGDGYPSGGLQGGSGTAGQGNTGSRSNSLSIYNGGGGGGAGGAGSGAYGGAALATWAGTFAGGGGGGYGGGPGGGAGAGAGGSGSGYGANATANTGSGGGGGGNMDAFGGNGGSGLVVIRYVNNGASGNYTWQLQEGAGSTWLRTSTHISANNGNGTRDDIVTVRTGGAAGTIVAKTKFRYTTMGWGGEELTQVTADPDTAALMTAYDYYTASAAPGNFRKVKSVTTPTGNWTAYQYYDDWNANSNRRGQLQYEFQPRLDTPAGVTLDPAQGRVVSYDYTADWSGRYTRPTLRQEKINNVLTGQTTWSHGDIVGSGWPREYAYASSYSNSAGNYQTDYEEHYRGDAGLEQPYRPYTTKAANLAQTAVSELGGTYNAGTQTFTAGIGGDWRQVILHGSTSASGAEAVASWSGQTFASVYLLPNKSTMDATIHDPAGKTLRTETWVYTGGGGFSLMTSENFAYDTAGRLTSRVANNGATVTNTFTNGLLTSTVGLDGTETQFTYDGLGRVATTVKKGAAVSGAYPAQGDLTTTTTYDGANRVTQTVSTGGALAQTATAAYDLAGRLTSSVAPGGYTTGFAYASGGKIVTATLPGGATRITDAFLDGQTRSVTGTAVVAEWFAHNINFEGRRELVHRQVSDTGPIVEYVYRDWLERQILRQVPAPTGSGYTDQQWLFNSSGQLYQYNQTGRAATLYTYDTLGRLFREGLDINANGALDLASDDRITEHGWTFLSAGGWWRRDTTSTYATSGSGTATQTGRVEAQLGGLPANRLNRTDAYDIHGNVTTTYSEVDRANKKVTTTTDTPDSTTNAVSVAYNGLPMESTDPVGVTLRSGYDALRRPVQSIDPRTGTTTTAYVSGTSLVATVTDPAGITQAAYTYDSAGRVATVTDALGKVARTAYTARNELYRQWGDTPNPVEYAYDTQGRRSTQSTFRGGSGWTGAAWPAGTTGTADTTTWAYHAPTGLLTAKTDAAARSVTYTYTQAGQLATRTWARGVVTTYAYSATTGEQSGITYSDGTTALGYSYNRLGKTATVADETGTRTFTYNLGGTLELQREDLPSFFNSRRLTYNYDPTGTGTKGRLANFTLGTSAAPDADQYNGYNYASDGRIQAIAGVAATYPSYTFALGYETNSHLLKTVSQSSSSYTDTRAYDPYHDWTDSRVTTISATTKAGFAYGQDNLGRVTAVTKTGELFSRYGNGTQGLLTGYGYSDRSEVTGEVTYLASSGFTVLTGRNDAYAFDNLGNRSSTTGTTHNGNTAAYTSNALNQYTQRTVPGIFDVAGAAGAGATVTVNSSGAGVTRHGEYFFKGQGMANNPNPVYSTLAVSDGTTTTNLPAFTAGTPEALSYDLDGNLTGDGRWNYAYDAENRLKLIQTSATALSAGYPQITFGYYYDYLGRRIRAVGSTWSGTGWVDHRFTYQAWNLVADFYGPYNGGNFPTGYVRNYFWGLDLSGTMQGAGGVGGLLMTQDAGQTYLPMYDAMGNVHGMIKASDGTIAAAYEYDAFGNTLRESGPYAASNPFRYSTKYTDIETGLVYYGLRYYSPALGRFINKDPIEEQGGLNLYGFCLNNGVNRWDYLGMDPLSDWMEENGLFPPQDTGALPPAGGYAPDPNAGSYGYEINEGMFQNDGAWDRISMWEVERYGVLNFNAMEGVSFMGQAEQTMGDHANYLYNGGSAFGFGTLSGGMSDRNGWFPGMRVTDDGRVVATTVTLAPLVFMDDDVPTPVTPYDSWGDTMSYQTPFPSTYQRPHVANSNDLFMGVIRGFDEQASALRYGHNVGVVVALGVTIVAVAPGVAVGAVDAATTVVLAGRGAANIIQFRVGLQLAASAGSSIAERTLIAEGLELGEAAWSARAAATAAAAVRAASAGGTSPPRP